MREHELSILVTGATGALGYDTVRAIRARHPRATIVLAVRHTQIPQLIALGCKTIVIDLNTRDDGAALQLEELLGSCTHVVHMAADVRWNQDLASSIKSNARVTQGLLDACRRAAARLRRFVYVSTAYTHPPVRHPATPKLIEHDGITFANAYEYSKYLGELHVRTSGLPFTIVRPSLILGSSRDGHIGRFNGLYQLAQYACTGHVPFMIAVRDSLTDIVPVDLVSQSVTDAIDDPDLEGLTTSVYQGALGTTVGDLVSIMEGLVNRYRQRHGQDPVAWPALIDPDRYNRFFSPFMEPEMTPGQLAQMRILKLFQPYLSALGPLGLADAHRLYQGPPIAQFIEPAIAFWLANKSKRALAAPHHWKRPSTISRSKSPA